MLAERGTFRGVEARGVDDVHVSARPQAASMNRLRRFISKRVAAGSSGLVKATRSRRRRHESLTALRALTGPPDRARRSMASRYSFPVLCHRACIVLRSRLPYCHRSPRHPTGGAVDRSASGWRADHGIARRVGRHDCSHRQRDYGAMVSYAPDVGTEGRNVRAGRHNPSKGP